MLFMDTLWEQNVYRSSAVRTESVISAKCPFPVVQGLRSPNQPNVNANTVWLAGQALCTYVLRRSLFVTAQQFLLCMSPQLLGVCYFYHA